MGHKADTHLLKNKVPLVVVQQLMRHSDPKLTAIAYADAEQLPLIEGVKTLPKLGLQMGQKGRLSGIQWNSSRRQPKG